MATGRSFARRLIKGALADPKSMMLVSLRSAATMAYVNCGLPIATSAASPHSVPSTRLLGKGRDPNREAGQPMTLGSTSYFSGPNKTVLTDFTIVVEILNSLLTRMQPDVVNSSWIRAHAPRCYRFIRQNLRSEWGGIDWAGLHTR